MVHRAGAFRALAALLFVAGLPAAARAQLPKPGLPLVPDRYATFTTSKGTWMSLDVSPDGQTIVFDLLGDLYTLPITGGKATRITAGLAHDMQPRLSPDGKRIAFVSDRSGDDNVWIASADGKDTLQLTRGVDNSYISPDWTPDGQYVYVGKGTPFTNEKLWLYNVHGGHGLQLGAAAGPRVMGPAMGPNPRYIWYAQRNGAWQYNAIMPQYQLAVYDRETGTRTTMSARFGSAFRPAISPDGKWLTYGSRQETETGLRIRELASGEERWLAYPDPARRSGIGLQHGCPARLLLHARLEGGGDLLWRRDLAGAGGRHRAGQDPLRRGRPGGGGSAAPVRVSHFGRGDVHGQADPGRGALARRAPGGLYRAGPAVRGGSARRHAAPGDQPGDRRVLPDLVARRQRARLRDLERRRRRPHHAGERRRRHAGRADPGAGLVPAAGLGAGWAPDRRGALALARPQGVHRSVLSQHRRRVRLGAGHRRRSDRHHRGGQPGQPPLHQRYDPDLRLRFRARVWSRCGGTAPT